MEKIPDLVYELLNVDSSVVSLENEIEMDSKQIINLGVQICLKYLVNWNQKHIKNWKKVLWWKRILYW